MGSIENTDQQLEVQGIKHLSDKEQAELIADKFAEVSNKYKPLDRSKINFPQFEEDEVPYFKDEEVLEVLLDLNINKATRSTDVPAKIKACVGKLYKPMAKVINNALKCGTWPDFLKMLLQSLK